MANTEFERGVFRALGAPSAALLPKHRAESFTASSLLRCWLHRSSMGEHPSLLVSSCVCMLVFFRAEVSESSTDVEVLWCAVTAREE